MKINKTNAFILKRKLHKYLNEKFGGINKINYLFCGDCKIPITLHFHINPEKAQFYSEPSNRAKFEKSVKDWVLKNFEIESDIFIFL